MDKREYAALIVVAFMLLVLGMIFLPNDPSKASLEEAYAAGCLALNTTYNCSAESVNSVQGMKFAGKSYSLGNLCASRGLTDSMSCAQSCGCTFAENATYSSVLFEEPAKSYGPVPVGDGVFVEGGIPEDEG